MAFIQVISGTGPSERCYLSDENSIGRTPENNICIDESRVSRKHASIRFTGEFYVVKDLDSKNGVYVNGILIDNYVPKPLYDGDEIKISDTVMVFNSEGQEPPGGKTQQRKSIEKITKKHTHDDLMGGLSVVMQREEANPFSKNATIEIPTDAFKVNRKESVEELREAVKRFQAMVKISSELGTVVKTRLLLEKIMDSIFDIFPHADRSFILLNNPETGDMEPVAGSRRDNTECTEERYELSQTIINTVINKRQSVLSSNAQQDDRFKGVHSVADFSIRSLMYVPFIHKEEILGIISVDNMSGDNAFNKNDLAMLSGIAAQAAVALKNVLLHLEVEKETQSRTQLSRYLSPDVVEGVLDGTIPLRLGGEEKYGTVLFCDIVGFTDMSENMSAVEVIEKLNRYFLLVTDVVTRNRGTLHKFEGDMVMAFWNVMLQDTGADENAVRTGLEMQIAIWLFSLEMEAEGQKPVYLGVGCNTGAFAGGNVGGKDKMEYTVIGDNINIGKRIEALSGRWQVFVAQSTYDSVKTRCVAIGLPETFVKGKSYPLKIFSLRGIALSAEKMLLCIPVLIRDKEGAYSQKGIIAGCTVNIISEELIGVDVYSKTEPSPDSTVSCRLIIPELDNNLVLNGTLHTIKKESNNGKSLYYKCKLSDIKADETTLSLFKPGCLIESEKNWDDIKRK